MWMIASFDLPTNSPAAPKRYRLLRKTLIACGFSSVQKSVFWRWCDNPDRRDAVVRKLSKAVPDSGNLLIFQLPDNAFAQTIHIVDNNNIPAPLKPNLWTILA